MKNLLAITLLLACSIAFAATQDKEAMRLHGKVVKSLWRAGENEPDDVRGGIAVRFEDGTKGVFYVKEGEKDVRLAIFAAPRNVSPNQDHISIKEGPDCP